MIAKFECAQIVGISACVPLEVTNLRQFGQIWGEQEIDRIISSTGIESVRIAPPDVTTSDLCFKASQVLLEKLGIPPREIDGVVFVSQSPDYIMPATSAVLQDRLDLRTDVVAFDINYGCSGYIYGLAQAHMLIQSGFCRTVLVCVGDTTTRMISPRDRSVRMVFGDAGSATLLRSGNTTSVFSLKTDGSGSKSLCIPAGGARLPRGSQTAVEAPDEDGNFRSQENLFMDGLAIMNYAVREVPPVLDEVLMAAGWHKEDVGLYALHQANRFMIQYLKRKCRLPDGTVPFGATETGNTGPASIPLLLCGSSEIVSNRSKIKKTILCGFGVGFSTAAVATSLENTILVPAVEVDK